jgi:hypothetical protein
MIMRSRAFASSAESKTVGWWLQSIQGGPEVARKPVGRAPAQTGEAQPGR